MEKLKPIKSIVLYANTDEKYAEIHDINEDGNFLAGRPLTRNELRVFASMAENQKENKSDRFMFYRNVIAFESNDIETKLAWIYPAQKIKLFFSDKVKGLETGDYYVPNLIFVSNGKKVGVYAIKKKDLFNMDPKTQLYKAPFMNIYDHGSVCMGTAKIGKFKDNNELMKNVENAFFTSKFTHTNYSKIVKGSLINAYKNQKKKFQESLLLPDKKLEDVWK